jgi:hypothetical protein
MQLVALSPAICQVPLVANDLCIDVDRVGHAVFRVLSCAGTVGSCVRNYRPDQLHGRAAPASRFHIGLSISDLSRLGVSSF